jgi:hypothetical protein
MKKLSFLLASTILSFAASAQLQNLDFENWNQPISTQNLSNRPTGWTWSNGLVIDATNNFYYPPATYAQQNNYALYLSVWYNYTKDVAIQRAPISTRPGALSGWYNYKHNIIGGLNLQKDTAMVSVYLTKRNHTTNSTDTIGKGIMEIGDSTDVYTGFLLEINYTSTEMPDSITIILDPSLLNRYRDRPGFIFGGGDEGACCTSFFLVDNLSLHGSVMGIDDANIAEQISVYPNPATDEIRIDMDGEVSIWDASGRKVGINYNHTGTINVSSLTSGQYFIQIKNEKNIYKAKFIKR